MSFWERHFPKMSFSQLQSLPETPSLCILGKEDDNDFMETHLDINIMQNEKKF